MKTRLSLFAAALLLLPYAGLLLSGGAWGDAPIALPAHDLAPGVATLLTLLGIVLASNFVAMRRGGGNPLQIQRNYYLAVAAASGVLGWMMVYLDRYAASWETSQATDIASLIVQTAVFALLAPAILSVRALLGSHAGLLKRLAGWPAAPRIAPDKAAFALLPLALLGLTGGAVWPEPLFWLLWSAPLLLLVALQLLWQEGTVFSGLPQGDWGRVLCAALAGLLVGNLAMSAFRLAGGLLILQLPNALFAQLGYALFGLLCLQLGDAIAEFWRGTTRQAMFKKRTLSIPIVVKK